MIKGLLIVVTMGYMVFLAVSPAYAREDDGACFCHNKNNHRETECVSKVDDIFKHSKDALKGDDDWGKCGEKERDDDDSHGVPEFGILTGGLTMLATTGAIVWNKKRKG